MPQPITEPPKCPACGFYEVVINQDILAVRYKETCAAAQERSKAYACSCHVLARVALLNGHPVIYGFVVDDFSDGSVIITYSNGEVWTSHTISENFNV